MRGQHDLEYVSLRGQHDLDVSATCYLKAVDKLHVLEPQSSSFPVVVARAFSVSRSPAGRRWPVHTLLSRDSSCARLRVPERDSCPVIVEWGREASATDE